MSKKSEQLEELKTILTHAYSLKAGLKSIPLNIATNSQGNQYLKPPLFLNPKVSLIKQEAIKFAQEIESLPFEIPYFDDDTICSQAAVLNQINQGVYNVVSLCYNKAVLTIYNHIKDEFGEYVANSALNYAGENLDRSYINDGDL